MKSKVYFIGAKNADDIADVNDKLRTLLAKSGVLDVARKDGKAGVKLHFGEEGSTGFVRPDHVRVICDEILHRGAVPVLSDTNTLYRGKRLNPADHLALAHAHGFTRDKVGADIFIPDDTKKEEVMEVRIDQSRIKTAKVARFYIDVDAMVVVSHFKGHGLAGFGGALKNIGMGCAMREGKLAQHCDASPVFSAKDCTGCGECALVCPVGALQIEEEKSVLDRSKCIGCGSCISACPNRALFVDMKVGNELVEKMVEYAYAVLRNRQNSSCYLNFALRINQECDCWSLENHQVAPDVGILASLDPVSIDKASFDLVNKACGRDIFKEIHPGPDGLKQLEHAAHIGLGNLDYELIEL
jgi:uncharacterized protein